MQRKITFLHRQALRNQGEKVEVELLSGWMSPCAHLLFLLKAQTFIEIASAYISSMGVCFFPTAQLRGIMMAVHCQPAIVGVKPLPKGSHGFTLSLSPKTGATIY